MPGGSSFVNLRLWSKLHEAYWASEQMRGISYLFFLRNLVQQVETDWEQVQHGNVVVLGSEQAIAKANARREDVLQVTKLI